MSQTHSVQSKIRKRDTSLDLAALPLENAMLRSDRYMAKGECISVGSFRVADLMNVWQKF